MIPLSAPSPSLDRHYSDLQSANMVSSAQQQRSTSYSTYKVQSNQYSTSGERLMPVSYSHQQHPGSQLKQNINELDTLLSDLNNSKSSTNGHHVEYPTHGASSDDYSLSENGLQGHAKRTVSSFNEYSYQTNTSGGQQSGSGGDYYGRKPPSPSMGRRRAAGSPGANPTQKHTLSNLTRICEIFLQICVIFSQICEKSILPNLYKYL
jgi:hypothetical protein